MNVTINQIRQEMTTLVQAHEMVNSFFWGDFHRAYNEKEQFYPLVCSYLSDGAINTNLTQMQLVVIVCDKTFKGFENLNDTESDTVTVARHLFNVIKQSPRWNALLRVNSSTFTKFYENTSDEVAGVILTMNVDVKQSRSLCDLPLDNYDFDGTFIGNDCEPVLIINSDQSFSFNAPSGTIVELPDTPVLVTDQDGNPLGGESVPSVTGGTIEVTITPTPCADATFEINGIEVATIPSGDTGSIQVLQGGLEVGELIAGNWIVPECEVCEDGTVTVNRDGVFFANVPVASGGTATINVPSNCPPVAPLTYFEMVVKTDNTGASASNQFLLQFPGQVGVQIDWGDGTTQQYVFNGTGSNSTTKTYATAGTYTIRLYGWYVRIILFQNDANKVLSVNNWGVNVWASMLNSFRDTFNLVLNATDAPKLGTLTTMAGVFRNSSMNANIGHWILPATLTTIEGIFQNSGMNAANYTDTLVAWILQVGAPNNVNAGNQAGRTFDSSRPAPAPYMNAGAVRTFATTPVISSGKGWTISGDTVI
jgi:type 1 fimbria pilin